MNIWGIKNNTIKQNKTKTTEAFLILQDYVHKSIENESVDCDPGYIESRTKLAAVFTGKSAIVNVQEKSRTVTSVLY
jgi:hypothetical protein